MEKGITFLLVCSLILALQNEPCAGLSCFQCRNYENGIYQRHCPKDGIVDPAITYLSDCPGACFTRSDDEDPDLVYRGCTDGLYLPDPLPEDGCYDWSGEVWCLCTTDSCNLDPLGNSSGLRLDDHLNDPNRTINMDGPLMCYQCEYINPYTGEVNSVCPKDDRVTHTEVYSAPCNGSCFTHSRFNDTDYAARGCTDYQWGMPDPMAPPGCYSHNSATWCVCNTPYCNGVALGTSSGKSLDDHIYNIEEGFIEPDGINKCFNCMAVDIEGNYQTQCPKHEAVSTRYVVPCNGSCITRSYDYNDIQVGRGCSDQMGSNLPNPLPPDGCYKWYTETWCVCSTSRCNAAAIGEPMNIEFDAHLSGSPLTLHYSILGQFVTFAVTLFMIWRH